MLLAQKANPIEHLSRAAASFFEAHPEVGVLTLELVDSLGTCPGCAGRAFERFHSGFGLKGAPAKGCQLVAKMLDESLEVREGGFRLRQFVV